MRIAVISGASSGIGLEFAKELDKMSFDELWLIAKDDGLLDNIKHILNTKTKLIPIDLSNSESFNEIKKLYEEESPEIEYLVCSAGVGFNGAFENITQKQIDLTVSINCTALSLLNSISLPFLTRGAKIINIASGSGFMPQPYFAVYAASKAYVISLSRALNYELKKNKISVTAVCPGPVNTSFFSSLENVKEYKKKFLITPQKVAMGALKAAGKRKTIYTPTFSMKLVHLASKLLPTSLELKFYKE
ncbi:MAG: SDR family NAD(P)-dependent oxidoreductase [Clostridia bacterium]|nr:SDR family NAD(P)-dependent oxidoreductase [Clostridia bacterium]